MVKAATMFFSVMPIYTRARMSSYVYEFCNQKDRTFARVDYAKLKTTQIRIVNKLWLQESIQRTDGYVS